MPKFTMTRQFLVPHYQHIVVEAETVEAACLIALGQHPTITEPDWGFDAKGSADEVRDDFDNARPTEIERIVAGEWRQRGEGGPEKGAPNPYAPDPKSGPQPQVLAVPTRPAEPKPNLFGLGYRFRLKESAERYPWFIAPAGLTGTVTEINDEVIEGKMDQPLPGAEIWENCIQWGDGTISREGKELSALGWFLDSTEPEART